MYQNNSDINKRIASLLLEIKMYRILGLYNRTDHLFKEIETLQKVRELDIWIALTEID